MAGNFNGNAGVPQPIMFDQTFVDGAQRDWPDSDLFEPNPPPRPGYNPGPNPAPGPPPPPIEYMPPPGVLPPVDPFQTGRSIPPPMPLPSRRYISPHQLPSWNSGSMGTVPVLGESGSLSPLLATVAGGVIGYMLAGWKGSVGGAMVVLGANNLGLAATDKPMLRLGVAALGIGVGGYFVHMASKSSPVRPNPPKWLKRVEDEPEEDEPEEDED